MSVTVISVKPKRGGTSVEVCLSDSRSLILRRSAARQNGLRKGAEIEESLLVDLLRAEQTSKALTAGLRLIGHRPRSEQELRERLARRFDQQTVADTVARLRELGYLDDASFARFWLEARAGSAPRSRRMVRLELRRKGVDSQLIEKTLQGVDDEATAYRAGLKKALKLTTSDYAEFNKRLSGFLRQRGFGYQVSRHTIEQLWQELGKGPASPGDETADC